MNFRKVTDILHTYTDKWQKNHLVSIVIVAFIGILLLLIGNGSTTKKAEPTAEKGMISTEKTQSREMEKMLQYIPGVSHAYVFISYEDSGQSEYAYDYKGDISKKEEAVQENTDNQMVITRKNGNEEPILIRQISPTIKGVTVIVQGDEEPALKYKIHNAVKSALGVDAYKIEVILN